MARLATQCERFPDLAIGGPRLDGLDDREAALAVAIYELVITRWTTLGRVIEVAGGKPLDNIEPTARAALLAGAAQALLMDRVPDHAIVDEGVEWTKRRRPRAAGLVNAVLRRAIALRGERLPAWDDRADALPLAAGGAVALAAEILPADPVDRVALACGIPEALARGWAEQAGMKAARDTALHSIVRVPTVVCVRHAAAPVEHPCLVPHHRSAGHRVWTGPRADLEEILASRTDVWVQDASASAAVELLAGAFEGRRPPRRILDACAGQGTKTRQLAAVFPDAEIVAAEVDRERLGVLSVVFAGHPRVRVVPAREVLPDLAGRIDALVLDVPCSNTGVLPRRPEARWRATPGAVERLVGVQRQIVADTLPTLADGGVLLYSTCSLEEAENGAMLRWLARWHGMGVIGEHGLWPAGLPGEGPEAYADGAFAAALARGHTRPAGA